MAVSSEQEGHNVARNWASTANYKNQFRIQLEDERPVPTKDLPSGVYLPRFDSRGLVMKAIDLLSDGEIELPDCPSNSVAHDIHKFWKSRARYRKFAVLFKRGILLEGPPGCGKTMLVRRLARGLVASGGIVILPGGYIDEVGEALAQIRGMEPDRPLIVILEDIERYIPDGEPTLLSLMDGEHQIDNCVYVATTNKLAELPGRLINRPSRFDVIVHIDNPTAVDRRFFMETFARRNELEISHCLGQWTNDTDGLSISHIKELMVSVFALDLPYEETLARLRNMGNL